MLSIVPSAGVDVGQQSLDLGFFPAAKPLRVANTQEGIAKIVALLHETGVGKIAVEAIGAYARKLVCALVEAGFSVFVVNPRRIKAFRDAEGLIAKTDRLDAALIARFAHKMSQDLRPLPDAKPLTLKAFAGDLSQQRDRSVHAPPAVDRTRRHGENEAGENEA